MKEAISTRKAPQAIGPYSQAIRTGDFLFVSGQVALDPETGEVIEGDIRAQTKRVMENIKAILEAAGNNLDSVVKTTIYLTDLGDFGSMNEIYATYFPDPPPARATVEVSALPKGAAVEIEAVAELS